MVGAIKRRYDRVVRRRQQFKFTAMTTSDDTSANDLLRALRAMFDAFGGADVCA